MTTEPELLSCPFCGGANVKASGSMSWTYVWCADCKAQGPTVWHGGPTADKDTLNRCQSGAIAAWNRREAATALSEAKAENERLREACAAKIAEHAEGERALQHAAREANDRRDTLIHMYAAQVLEQLAAAIRKGSD